jgi:hypothetical protein
MKVAEQTWKKKKRPKKKKEKRGTRIGIVKQSEGGGGVVCWLKSRYGTGDAEVDGRRRGRGWWSGCKKAWVQASGRAGQE